jgi:hypothetical protein
MNIDLPFLMAVDIPVNEENMKMFDQANYSVVFEEYKQMKNRIGAYEELIMKKAS